MFLPEGLQKSSHPFVVKRLLAHPEWWGQACGANRGFGALQMFPFSSLHILSCDSSKETVQTWTWGVWDVSLKFLVLKLGIDVIWLSELRPWRAHSANTAQFSLFPLSIVLSGVSFRRVWNHSINHSRNHSIGMRESFNCSVVFSQQSSATLESRELSGPSPPLVPSVCFFSKASGGKKS